MKRNSALITTLFLIASILLQSCVATIISTPKQSVKINSVPSRANVSLDDQKIGKTPTKVRIKRKTGGEIKIEKEGYKTYIQLLYPAKLNPVSFISLIFFLYPYYVDLATGAGYNLNEKELNVKLIKIPNKIDSSEVIFCNEVNLRFKAGDKLGNFYIKKKREEILYFGESLDVDAVNLKKDANNILKDLGFEVADMNGQLFSPTAQARYFIKAEVLNTRYDIKATSRYKELAKFLTECEMKIKWQLVNRNDDVKFEATTTGISTIYDKGGTAAFYDAFENSFYAFLYNEEIYEIVKQVDNTIDESLSFSIIKIKRPSNPSDNDKVINNAINSVVTIDNKDSHGSGCVISENGYIVTNYHVVRGLDKVLVKFKNGISLEGDVVRYNEEYDLALIKVKGSGFTPLPIYEGKDINIGSDIYAIGTPADKTLGQTVTKGIISGSRNILDKDLIQTDVSISPGSSGGGLINKKGYLIGIVNAKLVGQSVEGIGFAIPSYLIFDKLKIEY